MDDTKKIIEGDVSRATSNTSCIFFSESPTHFENISGPFTAIKDLFVCAEAAFAKSVLLQPGGP